MYVYSNIEERSRNRFRRGKVRRITYSVCVPAALVIQPAMRVHPIIFFLSPVWLYHIFSHYAIKGAIFGKELIGYKMRVLIFSFNFLQRFWHVLSLRRINRLTPNDPYMGRTAPLTSKLCILYIYSTNRCTEYFKHALYSPFFFSLQNAVCFIMLTCLFPVLFTFYIRVCEN